MDKKIEVGTIVNTHGLRGDVKIISWCDYPEKFEDFSEVFIDDKPYKIENIRYHKGSVLLKLEGIDNIDLAERYKNKSVFALRSDFDLPEGKYFLVDLIGLKVITEGAEIGYISDIIETGANDVYVIKRENRKDLLFPATKETVVNTDVEGGFIEIIIPKGLDEI